MRYNVYSYVDQDGEIHCPAEGELSVADTETALAIFLKTEKGYECVKHPRGKAALFITQKRLAADLSLGQVSREHKYYSKGLSAPEEPAGMWEEYRRRAKVFQDTGDNDA